MMRKINKRNLLIMLTGIIFGMIFGLILGGGTKLIENLWYTNHNFYKINAIYVLNKEVEPCSSVQVTFERYSEISDPKAVFTRELTFVQVLEGKELYYEVDAVTRTGAIDEGLQTITGYVQLPCELNPGIYFLKYTAGYRVNGYERTTKAYSSRFAVVDPKISI